MKRCDQRASRPRGERSRAVVSRVKVGEADRFSRIASAREQRLLLAVLGHQADAVLDGVARASGSRPACRRPGSGRCRTGRRRRSRAPARCGRRRPGRRGRGSRRARTAKLMSWSDVDGRRLWPVHGRPADLEHRISDRLADLLLERDPRVAADHHPDDPGWGGVGGQDFAGMTAVAQDGVRSQIRTPPRAGG